MEQLQQLAEWLDTGEAKIEASDDHWRAFMFGQLFEGDMPAVIASLPWKMVETHLGRFITSDNPFSSSRVFERATNGRRRSLLSNAVETTYPLDPTHVLVMRVGIDETPGIASAKWRRDQNRRILEHAASEFYAAEAQPDMLSRFGSMTRLEMKKATYYESERSSILHTWMPEVAGLPFEH